LINKSFAVFQQTLNTLNINLNAEIAVFEILDSDTENINKSMVCKS